MNCEVCGNTSFSSAGYGQIACNGCGSIYEECVDCSGVRDYTGYAASTYSVGQLGVGDALITLAIGAFVFGAIIYVPTVRAWTIDTVRKGAGWTKRQIDAVIKKGEAAPDGLSEGGITVGKDTD